MHVAQGRLHVSCRPRVRESITATAAIARREGSEGVRKLDFRSRAIIRLVAARASGWRGRPRSGRPPPRRLERRAVRGMQTDRLAGGRGREAAAPSTFRRRRRRTPARNAARGSPHPAPDVKRAARSWLSPHERPPPLPGRRPFTYQHHVGRSTTPQKAITHTRPARPPTMHTGEPLSSPSPLRTEIVPNITATTPQPGSIRKTGPATWRLNAAKRRSENPI